jgi:hypothetical protein
MSFGGCLILTETFRSIVPRFMFSFFKLPKDVAKHTDFLRVWLLWQER